MATVFHGTSRNASDIDLHVGNGVLKTVWKVRIPYQGKIYMVLETTERNEEADIDAGELFCFYFDGDINTYEGEYTLEENDDIVAHIQKEYDKMMAEDDKPQPEPKPQEKPKPKPKKDPEPEPQPKPSYDSSSEKKPQFNEGFGPWLVIRDACYILGIGFSFGAVILAYILILYSVSGYWNAAVALGILTPIPLGYFAISGINCICGLRDKVDIFSKTHNASMVLGLVTLNPFAIIAGWANYRYRVSTLKMKPVEE